MADPTQDVQWLLDDKRALQDTLIEVRAQLAQMTAERDELQRQLNADAWAIIHAQDAQLAEMRAALELLIEMRRANAALSTTHGPAEEPQG